MTSGTTIDCCDEMVLLGGCPHTGVTGSGIRIELNIQRLMNAFLTKSVIKFFGKIDLEHFRMLIFNCLLTMCNIEERNNLKY